MTDGEVLEAYMRWRVGRMTGSVKEDLPNKIKDELQLRLGVEEIDYGKIIDWADKNAELTDREKSNWNSAKRIEKITFEMAQWKKGDDSY